MRFRPTAREQRRSWDANARAWVEHVSGGGGYREWIDPAVLRALGPVRGRRFLDVGCGEGRFGRLLAGRGAARVLGIDLSEPLLRAARRAGSRLPAARRALLEYRAADASRFDAGETFDGIVSYLSLMHLADPRRALGAWRAMLRPRGRLVVVLPHPFTQSPGSAWQLVSSPVPGVAPLRREAFRSGTYFPSAWTSFRFPGDFPATTRNLHQSLTDWSAEFGGAGLVWSRLFEPRPSAGSLRRHPDWAPLREQPYFLVLRAEAYGSAG